MAASGEPSRKAGRRVLSVAGRENDHSEFHERRRARAAERAAKPDRLAVLVVDAASHAEELSVSLVGQPVELQATDDPAAALLLVGRGNPDVVLHGPVAGTIGPLDFLEIVRTHLPNLPVIVGVGQNGPELAAQALGRGATAVLPHPYRPERLLRLLTSLAPEERHLELRPLPIDLGRLQIDGAAPVMTLDGVTARLPMREYLLLRYLAERVGAVVSRAEIAAAVWGSANSRDDSSLTVHILRLRRRLGDDSARSRWITAIRGLGYQFTVPN